MIFACSCVKGVFIQQLLGLMSAFPIDNLHSGWRTVSQMEELNGVCNTGGDLFWKIDSKWMLTFMFTHAPLTWKWTNGLKLRAQR